ncbi:hypothetical protein [Streptomyces sp. NPDC007172]|uniref:hypothetical protein n=1 Tax=Streptomyces sp. NPDC007172 TaxID=3364776 RepID=UPI0036A0403E
MHHAPPAQHQYPVQQVQPARVGQHFAARVVAPPAAAHMAGGPELAATGAGDEAGLMAAGVGAVGLVLGGGVLYRRGRAMARA